MSEILPPRDRARWKLHADRALPAESAQRAIARTIYGQTQHLPIVSMHGHVEASVLADNAPFDDPAALLVTPDHYLVRMLISQGGSVPEDFGIRPLSGGNAAQVDQRAIWRRFCEGWHLFRGTPTRFWLEHVLLDVFDAPAAPSAETADTLYDHVAERLQRPEYRPRALFQRFGIELLATTDPADSRLPDHRRLADAGWSDRVIPTFRPDTLLEPQRSGWKTDVEALGESAGVDVSTYRGFLDALREQRQVFIRAGARATDHSHLVADTTRLGIGDAERLFASARTGEIDSPHAQAFTAHMLHMMAEMSADDGLVMQIHHGILRNHESVLARTYGADLGFDIPVGMEFTRALRPVLERFGRDRGFRMIVFTTDETAYSRELAPLAGAYPSVRLGAPWWFLDAPEAMRRFREATVETAGFYNTSGFVDDTRAFCSIPARHDLARRTDAGYLAKLVAEHRLGEDEAIETARALAYELPNQSYPPVDPTRR